MQMFYLFERIKKSLKNRIANKSERILSVILNLPKRVFSKIVVGSIGWYFIFLGYTKAKDEKILIIRNKYYSKNKIDLSTEFYEIDETLRLSGLVDFEVLTYDDLRISPIADIQLIQRCLKTRPTILILSSWSNTYSQPSIYAIQFIQDKLKIKVISFWWDTCSKNFYKSMKPFFDKMDLNVVIDNPLLKFMPTAFQFSKKIMPLWPPRSSELFFDSSKKVFDVSFVGQVGAYRSNREALLNSVKKLDLKMYISTKDRNFQMSHQEYSEILKKSKIVINLSASVDCHQVKGRVFEAMYCGALVLESENDQLKELFTPYKDYIPFCSIDDLKEKIANLISNENEIVRVTNNAKIKIEKEYKEKIFWEKILQRIRELT